MYMIKNMLTMQLSHGLAAIENIPKCVEWQLHGLLNWDNGLSLY